MVEAAPAPVVVAEVAPAPVASGPTIKWDGLVDSYYMYNFTSDPSRQPPLLRAYDIQSNSFTLAYAKLGLGVDSEMAAARIDVGYGQTGAIVNYGSAASSQLMSPAGTGYAPVGGQAYVSNVLVEQAYGTLKLGMLSLDLGKFNTSAGSEVIPANKNWLYSRSLLFNGITVNHTGLRATVVAAKEVTIQAAIVNGWNNDPDNNGDKTFGVSLLLTPLEGTFIGVNGYFGKEAPTGTVDPETRILVDVVVNQTLGEALRPEPELRLLQGRRPLLVGPRAHGQVHHQLGGVPRGPR